METPGFTAASVALWIEQNLWSNRRNSTLREKLEESGLNRQSVPTMAQRIVEITEGTQKRFNKGDHIIKAGDESLSMFFLDSGQAKVVSADLKRTHLTMKTPGNGFGEWGLLYGEDRTASVVAMSSCVIRELTRTVYQKTCEEMPEFSNLMEKVALRQWKSLASELKGDQPTESRKAHFIGREGYKCTIHGLPTFLNKFNNTVVKPRRLPQLTPTSQVQFEFSLEGVPNLGTVTLVVGEDKLNVCLDLAPVHAKTQKKKPGQLNNAGSVKYAIQDLCAQLRTAILKLAKQDQLVVENVFAQFDTDGNGVLDKDELLAGCCFLGIDVTMAEINALWPVIDTSGDGKVQCDEFVSFVKKSGRQMQHSKCTKATWTVSLTSQKWTSAPSESRIM